MLLSILLLSNQGAITLVSSCNESKAAPAPSPETGPAPPPLGPPPCEWDESYPWPEIRREGNGCDLIVHSGICDYTGCGYFTCEDNCIYKYTREQGCLWCIS
ncbi:hypothetical protein MKW94_010158 [Papaver nudicaule]|uniref:Secreted protein n=1 Tax=Papaver nudicaule TaxID=74823 RepID=A0AA41W1T8_PAPNU|nr:hypothetical protein [Papaver nudicaule]